MTTITMALERRLLILNSEALPNMLMHHPAAAKVELLSKKK